MLPSPTAVRRIASAAAADAIKRTGFCAHNVAVAVDEDVMEKWGCVRCDTRAAAAARWVVRGAAMCRVITSRPCAAVWCAAHALPLSSSLPSLVLPSAVRCGVCVSRQLRGRAARRVMVTAIAVALARARVHRMRRAVSCATDWFVCSSAVQRSHRVVLRVCSDRPFVHFAFCCIERF